MVNENILHGSINKCDDIVGKLNKDSEKLEYKGAETNTATVSIVDDIIIVDAKIDVEKIEAEYANVLSKFDKVKEYFNTVQKEIAQYESRFDAQDVKISKQDEKIAKQQEEIDKANQNIIKLKREVEEEITTKLEIVAKDIEKVKTDLNLRITELKRTTEYDISQLKADVVNIYGKIDELSERIDNISTTILPLIDEKISQLERKVNDRFYSVEKRLTADESKISKNESSIKSLNTKTATLSDGLSEVKSRVTATESSIEALDKRLTKDEDILENKVNQSTYDRDIALINNKLSNKASAMFYDSTGEYDPSKQAKSYWYMTSNNSMVDPQIIAGPYNFGTGGGGGGGGGGTTTKVTIEAVNWPSTIAIGSKCLLTIIWTSYKETTPTGNGTIALYVNEKLKLTQKNTPQGEVILDVSDYLVEGTNKVEIRATDAYSTSDKVIQDLTAVNIRIDSVFDANRILSGTFKYIYTPYGEGIEKTVHFIVDGKEIGTQVIKLSAEQQSYDIGGLTHGNHSLKVYFTCVIDGNFVTSNELFYDLIYEVSGNKTPIIASTFNSLQQEQYTAFTIPYRVYTPDHVTSNVQLYVNGSIIQALTVDQNTQYWEYRPLDYGRCQMAIVCDETRRIFEVTVSESSIDVKAVTQDLALYLTSTGRSNAEEHPEIWEDTERGISCDLTDFNFVSDGWLKDDNGNTLLKVTGDARVLIPYKPFKDDFRVSGKTIELEFSTSNIKDYETNIISCLSAADSFSKKAIFVSEDSRKKKFDFTLDINKFKSQISGLGTYNFVYTDNGWTIDETIVDLNKYGITLKEKIIDPEAKEEDPYILVGDTIIITYAETNRGFNITPQLAYIRSQQSELSTQYKEDEHVRVTFVVEKAVETRIIYMYLNGIMSGAYQYPDTDNFRQLNPVNISIGSNDATVNIYNIRVYDNNLNRRQVVNNWIADTQSGQLKKERFVHNDNYNDSGEIVISKLPTDIPHIIWDIDPLPQYKGDKRKGQAYYTDPVHPQKSFSLPTGEGGAPTGDYNVQGTSSSVYPVKNIRLKSKSGFIDNDLKLSKLWYVTDGGIGANYFTYKVDYASSEGANNVELTKLYNDASKSIGILTPPQRLDNRVRVGIDGFPIVAFHRDSTGKDSFCSKANFNNDKANEDVYGFMEGDESWEITNNSADEGNFKKPATPETFGNAFEIRFPDEDGYSDLSKLQPMTEWVVSTDPEQATEKELSEPIQYTYKTVVRSEDGTYSERTITSPLFTNDTAEYRLTKFKAELENWFNVDSTVFYYIFTHLYLLVDSRAKNAFPTYFASRVEGDGGNHWFWLPYDMDTALGM